MTRRRIALLVAFVATGLLASGCAREEAVPAATVASEAAAPDVQPATGGLDDGTVGEVPAGGDADAASAAAKPRWIPPVKGVAEIGYLPPQTKVVKDEVVTHFKIKNLSKGSISLLRVDEYWYDQARNMLPGDTQRWRQPFLPGEVIEIELRVPRDPRFHQNTFKFSHANGDIKATLLKTLDD
jgi:hypothetical protein